LVDPDHKGSHERGGGRGKKENVLLKGGGWRWLCFSFQGSGGKKHGALKYESGKPVEVERPKEGKKEGDSGEACGVGAALKRGARGGRAQKTTGNTRVQGGYSGKTENLSRKKKEKLVAFKTQKTRSPVPKEKTKKHGQRKGSQP